jgi:hypothetical protein
MKKRLSLLICGILLISPAFFMACSDDSENNSPPTYSVIGETYLRPDSETEQNVEVGIITASPSSGIAGTSITVTIKSKPGYVLDEVVVEGMPSYGKTNPVPVTLLDKNATVKAYFKAIPSSNYKVNVEQPTGGEISFKIDGETIEYGPAGATVTLFNKPSTGYTFSGYTATYAGIPIEIPTNTFGLPTTDVTVSGTFEALASKSTDQLIAAGNDALNNGNVAAAIDAYETAHSKDPDNAEVLVYSALGKLLSVATSSQVGNFFKNHLGLISYPNTLDALLDPGSWFTYYPKDEKEYSYYDSALGESPYWVSRDWYDNKGWFDENYTEGDGYYYWSYNPDTGSSYTFVTNVPRYEYTTLPPLTVPGWITDKEPYKDTLVTIDGKGVVSSSTWPIILIANLIDKNATGLNPALDDIIDAVFNNPAYKDAEARVASLKNKDPVLLDAGIIERFGLSDTLGGEDIYVSWAELELLLSALKLVKGTLLYVDSYNWEYNVEFVKDLPWDESIMGEDIIGIISSNRNKVLPLRANFMTARSGSYMEDSRKAYVEALVSILGVYDYYIGANSKLPAGYKDKLKEFEKYKTLVSDAKDAIDNKGSFTVPAELLNGETLSVDFGKLFNPGQLALENLIETEGSGNSMSPVFYSYSDDTPTKITAGNISDYAFSEELIGFKIKTDPITGIIVGGDALVKPLLEGSGLVQFVGNDAYIFFDSMVGTIAWAVYYWDAGGSNLLASL